MAINGNIPSPKSKLLNPDGTLTRDWYLFLSLLNGGGVAISYEKIFAPVMLTLGAATLVTIRPTVPTAIFISGRLRLTNVTGGAVIANLYAIPLGGAPAIGNLFVSKSIPASDYIDTDVPVLNAGDSIAGLAGANNSIVVHMTSGSFSS